jgi:hypothetical protein
MPTISGSDFPRESPFLAFRGTWEPENRSVSGYIFPVGPSNPLIWELGKIHASTA